MRSLLAFAIALLVAAPALAVNDTVWRRSPDGTGAECSRGVQAGDQCFWNFDAAGQSPMIVVNCNSATIWVEGTTPDVDPYTTPDGTFGSAVQFQAFNQRTSTFGAVSLTTLDWFMTEVPWRQIIFDRQGGSGNVVVECKE